MNNLTRGRAPLLTAQIDKVTDEYFICFFKMHKAVAKLCWRCKSNRYVTIDECRH